MKVLEIFLFNTLGILLLVLTIVSCGSNGTNSKEILTSSVTSSKHNHCDTFHLGSAILGCYHEALQGYILEQDKENQVNVYSALMVEHYYQNNLDSSEFFAETAFQKAKEFKIDSFSPGYSDVLYHMGLINERKNLFEKAEHYLNRALTIDKQLPNSPIDATYNLMGFFSMNRGDYVNAKSMYNQAILKFQQIRKSGEKIDQNYLVPYYYDLGYLHQRYDYYNQAKISYWKSLKQIDQSDDKEDRWYQQVAFNNFIRLAEIAIMENRLDSVSIYLDKTETIKAKFDTTLQNYYLHRFTQGKLARTDGLYKDALDYFNQAEQEILREYRSIEKDEVLTQPYEQKALLFFDQKKYKEALQNIQKAIHFVCKTFKSDDPNQNPKINDIISKYKVIELLETKAQIFSEQYNQNKQQSALTSALNTYLYINELIPIARQDVVEDASKFNLAKRTADIYNKAVDVSSKLFFLTKQTEYLDATLQFLEGNKTSTLLEDMKSNEALVKGNIPAKQYQTISNLKAEINYYEKEQITTNDQGQKQITERLFELKQRYQQQLKVLEDNYPQYYALKYKNQSISIKKIQQSLDRESLILEYFLSNKHLYLLTISLGKSNLYKLERRPKLNSDLNNLLSLIGQRPTTSDIEEFQQLASQLYMDLLGDISLDGFRKLLIIPDGPLSRLPFDVLLTSLDQDQTSAKTPPYSIGRLSYLIEQKEISYHYSGRLMLETMKPNQQKTGKRFLGISPDPSLASAQQEVSQIKEILGSGDLLSQKNATKKQILSQSGNYQILHFAAHARQDTRNPKFNEIELFGSEKLTSADIESMRIQADLTVLSACETGVGKLQTGEGVMSLARSFFIAGSPALVASLWKVDDVTTGNILTGFYKGLNNGGTKSHAIRQSKLNYMSEQKYSKVYTHPYYWSGLVMIGNNNVMFSD